MRALFGATSFSIYSEVVCAIILCSSVKSSGEKTRLGVVSVIRKLPPLKIVFCDATINSSFLDRRPAPGGQEQIPFSSHQILENARGAHSPADAHRDHSEAGLATFHLVKQRGGQFRSGATERVAERDRAAVDVQPFEI